MEASEQRQYRLIAFTRCAEAGKNKTRLIPAVGDEQATRIHVALARHTLTIASQAAQAKGWQLEVRFAGGSVDNMRARFGSDFNYQVQIGEDLGERLREAAQAAFQQGAQRVVFIGTDCPDLDETTLTRAFEELSHSDVVIGPAGDGGYYLIGMSRFLPELFCNIDWGTAAVCAQTEAVAQERRLRLRSLPVLSDVDHVDDLIQCRRLPGLLAEAFPVLQPGLISIIIPTLNEERVILRALESTRLASEIEILVVDGGSSDQTIAISQQAERVRIVDAPKGRARQMNAGAALARGELLLFLHADTLLPEGFDQVIREAVSGGACGGAFRLSIDDPRAVYRWLERCVDFRTRWLGRPYGDQAVFADTSIFFRIGGFPNWPLMEDYELIRRLRKHGTLRMLPQTVSTSARRWRNYGIVRTTLLNQVCVAGFHLGVPPATLARWYRGKPCLGATQ